MNLQEVIRERVKEINALETRLDQLAGAGSAAALRSHLANTLIARYQRMPGSRMQRHIARLKRGELTPFELRVPLLEEIAAKAGSSTTRRPSPKAGDDENQVECPDCHGTGEINGETCTLCGGSGRVDQDQEDLAKSSTRSTRIRIPTFHRRPAVPSRDSAADPGIAELKDVGRQYLDLIIRNQDMNLSVADRLQAANAATNLYLKDPEACLAAAQEELRLAQKRLERDRESQHNTVMALHRKLK